MNKARTFRHLIQYAWKMVCQQVLLLAVLSMLFLALPLCAGPVAEGLLSRGVAFSGLELAVCAPEGDDTARLVEQLTQSMRDIRSYAALRAMDREQALAALEEEEVTAVLILPEDFVSGVLNGENPDVLLITDGDRPLESLLTYWVGQSAADLLTSAQRGIYAVLELYPGGREDISWDQVKTGINLAYINRTLNRTDMTRLRRLQAVDNMEVGTHYGLSILVFLVMVLPPLLRTLFDREQLPMRRRLRSVGIGAWLQYGSNLTVCCMVTALLTLAPVLVLTRWNLAGAALLALFGGAWAALLCQLLPGSASCGSASFALALGTLFLCGGILPMPLLGSGMQALGRLLPLGMLRTLLYLSPQQWGEAGGALVGMALWLLVLMAAGWLLQRRCLGKEGAL